MWICLVQSFLGELAVGRQWKQGVLKLCSVLMDECNPPSAKKACPNDCETVQDTKSNSVEEESRELSQVITLDLMAWLEVS